MHTAWAGFWHNRLKLRMQHSHFLELKSLLAICDYLKSIFIGFMARIGEGHLLFQADLNKQLCTKCIINEKFIIPVSKHITHLLPAQASWLPWKAQMPPLVGQFRDTWGVQGGTAPAGVAPLVDGGLLPSGPCHPQMVALNLSQSR